MLYMDTVGLAGWMVGYTLGVMEWMGLEWDGTLRDDSAFVC